MLFQELVVFEDLNVFHSQEECVSLNPTQQSTSEKEEESVGEMMLLGKKSSPFYVQIECYRESMFYFISDFFRTPFTPPKRMFTHMFNFSHAAEPAPSAGAHFPCILGVARAKETYLGKQELRLVYYHQTFR